MRSLFGAIASLCLVSALAAAPAVAADLAGSKDPAFLKRYQGSEIVYYAKRPFDRYAMAVQADPANPNSWKWSETEGEITRIVYREPPGHSVLELMRNYEDALKEAELTLSFELSRGTGDVNFGRNFWAQNNGFTGQPVYGFLKADGYLTAKGTKDGRDVTVAAYFAQR